MAYKVNIQKSIVLCILAANKNELQKNPLRITKEFHYLELHVSKDTQDHYIENYQITAQRTKPCSES